MRLQSERLHEGLASQSLIEALLEAARRHADLMELPKTEEDRRLLASILMHEEEELTPETVEGAVRALRRIYLRRRLEEVQRACCVRGFRWRRDRRFCRKKCGLKRALMDPGLGEGRATGLRRLQSRRESSPARRYSLRSARGERHPVG